MFCLINGADVIEIVDENDEESDSDSDSSSDSDSDSSSGSDSEVITQDYLNSLLEQARRNILISQPLEEDEQEDEEEDIITLDSESTDRCAHFCPYPQFVLISRFSRFFSAHYHH